MRYADGDTDYEPDWGENPTELLAALLRACSPTGKEARAMLAELRQHVGCSRDFLAALLCVSKATLRRWEDGSRLPCRAACRFIALWHQALRDVNGLQLASWVCAEGRKAAADNSKPTPKRIEAVFRVASAAHFYSKLANRLLRVRERQTAG